jgi:hypothetical protein
MASLFRGKPRRPEFVVPPAESRAAEMTAAERIAEVDRHLAAIALIPAVLRTPEQWSSVDVLLDRRCSLKRHGVVLHPTLPGMPQVTYVPGGPVR